MMADRGLKLAVAAFGFSALLTGGAVAEDLWRGYAPRCQPTELTAGQAMSNPCEQQLAVFGLAGPQVLDGNRGMDVETTGSIDSESRRNTPGSARSPL
jgi:hypothetical protein